jgi:hypothetical protein
MNMMMEALGWLYTVFLFWPVGVAALFLADWLGVTRIVSNRIGYFWAWRRC